MPLLVTIATVVAIAVLSKKGFKGAIMCGVFSAERQFTTCSA